MTVAIVIIIAVSIVIQIIIYNHFSRKYTDLKEFTYNITLNAQDDYEKAMKFLNEFLEHEQSTESTSESLEKRLSEVEKKNKAISEHLDFDNEFQGKLLSFLKKSDRPHL